MSEFQQIAEQLNKDMREEYAAVSKMRNPIYRGRAALSKEQLAEVIGQYSLFPAKIVSYLKSAQEVAHLYDYMEVDDELKRNIREELGSDTDGVTHYDMLVRGVKESAGIDISAVQPTSGTTDFLSAMEHHTKHTTNPGQYVIGATYALESSAVPELEIVVDLTRDLVEKTTGKRDLSPTLERFFKDHLHTWEVGHESRLRDACANDLEIGAHYRELENFVAGFHGTMYAMDMWWSHLAYDRMKL
jgi:hypothetical protein